MKTTTAVLFCLGLCGCVSVPLSTIVRMSTFDEQDFAQLDPDVIRAIIKLPDGFELDTARSSLGVKLTSSAGDHFGDFRLEQITSMRTQLSAGMLSSDVVGTEYALKLSAPSKLEFRKLQTFVGKGRPGNAVIAIAPVLSSFPEDATVATVWVDLLLSKDQGYFTLLNAAEIPMEAVRAASAGR